MKLISVTASCDSTAAPHDIYPLLKDSSTYPQWSRLGSYEMERAGQREPHDVGEIRIFRTWPVVAREEMTEFDPDRCVAYRLLSGLPLKQYNARTTLEPLVTGGTRITWNSSFQAKYQGTGWFWRRFMLQLIRGMARDLARAAEARAAG